MGKKRGSNRDRLQMVRVVHVPLKEVSGICLRRESNGNMSLVAVGDRAATLAWAHVTSRDQESLDWETIDISSLFGSSMPERDPQIEAVCADGAGRILLLQEAPPRAELIDVATARVIASIALEVEGDSKLARSWSDPEGSRGEGAVLLPDGHLLVAKEKKPMAFIEFGPRGSQPRGLRRGGALPDGARWPVENGKQSFVPLAIWRPDKTLKETCGDFSDLEIGPDGRLYILSDQSATIARIDDLLPDSETAALTASWQLDDLDGKPEGLSFVPSGCALVALDTRKARNNLALLDPAIAAP